MWGDGGGEVVATTECVRTGCGRECARFADLMGGRMGWIGGKEGGRMNIVCSKLEQIGEWVSESITESGGGGGDSRYRAKAAE